MAFFSPNGSIPALKVFHLTSAQSEWVQTVRYCFDTSLHEPLICAFSHANLA